MAAECCSSCERTSKRTVGYPSTSWASCIKIGPVALKLWVVENRPSPLLCRLAYTTACTTVQAVILKVFAPSGNPTILLFPHQTGWQYSDWDPLTGAPNASGV